jgi:hypothetical protein
MDGYTLKRIDELASIWHGAVKLAGDDLGVESFGLQVLDLPGGFADYPEHDHAEDGQEELYALIGGSGWLDIEGERVELDAETLVRVAPGVKRKLYSGPDGTRVLVIGGTPGKGYEINPETELTGSAS